MDNTLAVAKALYTIYEEKFGTKMDEMKMHKLMYFTQRESFIQNNEPLFSENFYGWKYGPVLSSVRREYMTTAPFSTASNKVSDKALHLINSILDRYGTVSSWRLSMMSHAELSWKLAREGLAPSENGENALSTDAIKLDAVRESISRSYNK